MVASRSRRGRRSKARAFAVININGQNLAIDGKFNCIKVGSINGENVIILDGVRIDPNCDEEQSINGRKVIIIDGVLMDSNCDEEQSKDRRKARSSSSSKSRRPASKSRRAASKSQRRSRGRSASRRGSSASSRSRSRSQVSRGRSVSADPKPKRAISGYHVYVKNQLSNTNYDKAAFARQMKAIGARWQSMSESEKAKLQDEAARVNRLRERSKKAKASRRVSKSTSSASKTKPKSRKR